MLNFQSESVNQPVPVVPGLLSDSSGRSVILPNAQAIVALTDRPSNTSAYRHAQQGKFRQRTSELATDVCLALALSYRYRFIIHNASCAGCGAATQPQDQPQQRAECESTFGPIAQAHDHFEIARM